MSGMTVAGIVAVLVLNICISVYSGEKVKNGRDFLTGGGKAGAGLVCGGILGSLISGQSTIGTAQLAFHFGLSAWWFTLGSGLGCLALAFCFVCPLRRSGRVTELQIVCNEYGSIAETLGSVLNVMGIFLTVLVQVISCIGLFTLMFPSLTPLAAASLTVAAMCANIVFGGAWGAGLGGMFKVGLLYLTLAASFVIVLLNEGGLSGLATTLASHLAGTPLGAVQNTANGLSNLPDVGALSERFFNLLARGPGKDLGSCLSLILGVLSTQTYAQAVWSAKNDKDAKHGVLLGALLCPPLGVAGILVGLSMRAHCVTAAEAAALVVVGQGVPGGTVIASTVHVLPAFALEYFTPLAAGMLLGTLLVTVIGGGAGLTLGMAAIFVKDMGKLLFPSLSPRSELAFSRAVIVAILSVAAAIALAMPGKMLNDLGFLSMGLRAGVIFVPLCYALFLPGRICSGFVIAAMLLAPASMIAGQFFKLPFDSLLLGMCVAFAVCTMGVVFSSRR